MKKIYTILLIFTLFITMYGCRSDNKAIEIIVNSYLEMSQVETIDVTEDAEGEMLGDAYYVIGTMNESLLSVNHYMNEYMSIEINFGEETNDELISIESIHIIYRDDEKEIYFVSHASSEGDHFVREGIDYHTFFEGVENLSIQDIRYILREVKLL